MLRTRLRRVAVILAAYALAGTLSVQALAVQATASIRGAGEIVQAMAAADHQPPGKPCHEPDIPEPIGTDIDFGHASAVVQRFDDALLPSESYGGSCWHEEGGIRVRVAGDRPDYARTIATATELMAEASASIPGGVRLEATDVSLRDLQNWELTARRGLENIAESAVTSTAVDELCQYVAVYVMSPDKSTLSTTEKSRYSVSAAPEALGPQSRHRSESV